MRKPPVVWTIAGFDPSSGAGVTADLKTIAALGGYGVACITALTVQNTLGVQRVEVVSAETIRQTLRALLEDLPPAAIKIGMLATAEITGVVSEFLEALPEPRCPVVLDPILRSSSGACLLEPQGVRLLRGWLIRMATVVTPNRAEAAALTGLAEDDGEALALAVRQLGAKAAVVTGGDAAGDEYSEDVLAYELEGMEMVETLRAPRILSQATHGTGCAFSTAIACGLADGKSIPRAVTAAKAFVGRAIERAPGLGQGKGPMGLERAGE